VKRRRGDDYQSIEYEKITNTVESRQEVKKLGRASEQEGVRNDKSPNLKLIESNDWADDGEGVKKCGKRLPSIRGNRTDKKGEMQGLGGNHEKYYYSLKKFFSQPRPLTHPSVFLFFPITSAADRYIRHVDLIRKHW